ncbi:hypothetical protein [Gynuella sunshinyii]|uniref:Uncharacterized protein n=1 Tax=Gynuella sunshinyii YC6258 TaxID=1445510 RepID=A0A0C5VTN2_9GAMM|nr:hypothetical protein [Gynuella sunshinyii]AJQ93679.1 hypothetical Protein YC6258_01631 [Gynuella sunshinyii YC6258]
MIWIKRLIPALLLLTGFPVQAVVFNHRQLLIGSWQCKTAFVSEQGKFRVSGNLTLNDNGSFSSVGDVFAYNALINTELPMSYQSAGSWDYQNQIVKGDMHSHALETGFPMLNRLVAMLDQQVRQHAKFSARLVRITDLEAEFEADDHTRIQCKR